MSRDIAELFAVTGVPEADEAILAALTRAAAEQSRA